MRNASMTVWDAAVARCFPVRRGSAPTAAAEGWFARTSHKLLASFLAVVTCAACDLQTAVQNSRFGPMLSRIQLSIGAVEARSLVNQVLDEAGVQSRLDQKRLSVRWGASRMTIVVEGSDSADSAVLELGVEGPVWITDDLFFRMQDFAGRPIGRNGTVREDRDPGYGNDEVRDLYLRRRAGAPAPVTDAWRTDGLHKFPDDVDGRACRALVEAGANMDAPMELVFVLDAPSEESLRAFARSVQLLGFWLEGYSTESPWRCKASRPMRATYHLIQATLVEMRERGAEHGGEVIGWSSAGN